VSTSPATIKALREAMARLIEGRPAATDGRLTKENLYKEAGVSRATMNRAAEVMEEWDVYTAEHGRLTRGEARRDDAIEKLRKELRQKKVEITELQRKLDAAATVIAALHHDNTALREHLEAGRGGNVIRFAQPAAIHDQPRA
jgi:predicted RNase H-like nuclease (RuvC/YqgF family)